MGKLGMLAILPSMLHKVERERRGFLPLTWWFRAERMVSDPENWLLPPEPRQRAVSTQLANDLCPSLVSVKLQDGWLGTGSKTLLGSQGSAGSSCFCFPVHQRNVPSRRAWPCVVCAREWACSSEQGGGEGRCCLATR